QLGIFPRFMAHSRYPAIPGLKRALSYMGAVEGSYANYAELMKAGLPIMSFVIENNKSIKNGRRSSPEFVWTHQVDLISLAISHGYSVVPVATIHSVRTVPRLDHVKFCPAIDASSFVEPDGSEALSALILETIGDAVKGLRARQGDICLRCRTWQDRTPRQVDRSVQTDMPIPPATPSPPTSQDVEPFAASPVKHLSEIAAPIRPSNLRLAIPNSITRPFNGDSPETESTPLDSDDDSYFVASEEPTNVPPAYHAVTQPRVRWESASTLVERDHVAVPASKPVAIPSAIRETISNIAAEDSLLWDMARAKVESSATPKLPAESETGEDEDEEDEEETLTDGEDDEMGPDRELLHPDFVRKVRKLYEDDPIAGTLTDDHIAKYLITTLAAKGREEDAMKAVATTLDWRRKYDWDQLLTEDFSDVERTGKLYWFHRTKDGSPVLTWRAARHFMEDEAAMHRTIRFMVYTVELAKKHGFVKDRATIIIDRLDIINANKDPALLRTLATTFQQHYPEHIDKLIMFPKNMLLTLAWNVTKVFLNPNLANRVEMLGTDYKEQLQKYIDRDCLIERYGGTQKDPYEGGEPFDVTRWNQRSRGHKRNGSAASLAMEVAAASGSSSTVKTDKDKGKKGKGLLGGMGSMKFKTPVMF
ncbi:hypothetical protein HK104_001111, partial [Borealophlyctis nickersoniae]